MVGLAHCTAASLWVGLPDNTDACYAGDKTYNGWVGPFLP
jgi:hypothetical protein